MEKINGFEAEVVVVGGGDYPSNPLPLSVMRGAEKVVCLDGAAKEYIEREGKSPWRIVGDGDSLPVEFKERYRDILRQFSEQENNDQTKATLYLKEKGIRRIAYVGATGRREDHTLGNISLLMDYMEMGLDVRMYTDYGVFIPCRDCSPRMSLPCGTQVSVFSFGVKNLKSEGLKYPLYDIEKWWQGTLNEVVREDFRIEGEGKFIIFVTYEVKRAAM